MTNHTEVASIRLINDISAHFQHRPPEEAAESVAHHIRLVWDPRMRTALLAHIDRGGVGLEPLSIAAAQLLRQPPRIPDDLRDAGE